MGRSNIWVAALVVTGLVGPALAHAGSADSPSNTSDSTNQADAPSPAPAENDKADESFHAGRELLKDKRYADACPKFEESQRVDPASGTLLALAYCQEQSGLLATSWANYGAAARLAEREGHADRQSAATQRAQSLANRLSRLTVVVPPELLSLPGFHLTRDGIEFERASFGVPIPMDGGTHAFVATAPNRIAWTSTVTLYGERDQKTLVLPILDPVTPPRPADANGSRPVVAPDSEPGLSGKKLAYERASLAFAGATVVGLGLGTAFALSAKSKNDASNANGHCTGDCDDRGVQLRNSALTAARVSTWSFVASGALAVCSVTLYLTANAGTPTSASPARATAIQATVSLGAPSVSLVRSF